MLSIDTDVAAIKAMIDREYKAARRLEKVKNKRFDPFLVFKNSGLGRYYREKRRCR